MFRNNKVFQLELVVIETNQIVMARGVVLLTIIYSKIIVSNISSQLLIS